MRHSQAKALPVLSTFLVILLLTGCAAQTKRKWLEFFFDGVPPESSNATNSVPATTPAPVLEFRPQPGKNRPQLQPERRRAPGLSRSQEPVSTPSGREL